MAYRSEAAPEPGRAVEWPSLRFSGAQSHVGSKGAGCFFFPSLASGGRLCAATWVRFGNRLLAFTAGWYEPPYPKGREQK